MTSVLTQLPLILIPALAELALTRGQVALIAAEDRDWAQQWHWQARHIRQTWYASRHDHGRTLYLHRAIWERRHGPIPAGRLVDHIDGDGLHNTPDNLRLATVAQNSANGRARGRSPYRGVAWHSYARRWRARIKKDGVSRWLGYFDSEKEAALAYDRAAVELFGEFARLNFPLERRLDDRIAVGVDLGSVRRDLSVVDLAS